MKIIAVKEEVHDDLLFILPNAIHSFTFGDCQYIYRFPEITNMRGKPLGMLYKEFPFYNYFQLS